MKKKGLIIAGCIIAAVALCSYIVLPPILDTQKFNSAIEALENGDLSTASQKINSVSRFTEDRANQYIQTYTYAACKQGNFNTGYHDLPYEARDLISEDLLAEMNNYRSYEAANWELEKGNFLDAYNDFLEIAEYNDSQKRADQILVDHEQDIFEMAVKKYESSDSLSSFSEAKRLFELIPSSDSSEYLKKIDRINKMIGTYHNGTYLYVVDYSHAEMSTKYNEIRTSNAKIIDFDGIPCIFSQLYGFENRGEIFYLSGMDNTICFRCVDILDDGTIKEDNLGVMELIKDSSSTNALSQPKVGMTSEEVLKSTWGKPQKINKTTYSNNVSEQWVYSINRYVYLENDIVTAIQE